MACLRCAARVYVLMMILAVPAQGKDLKGQHAVVVLKDGSEYEGTIQEISPQRLRFAPNAEGISPSWPASLIRSVQIGNERYLYNAVKDVLEKPERPEIVTLEVTGTGQTDTEALKDAIRNAVRQAYGALIDTETLIQNDEVVRDKILSLSEGIVTDYQEIDSRRDNGLSALGEMTWRTAQLYAGRSGPRRMPML